MSDDMMAKWEEAARLYREHGSIRKAAEAGDIPTTTMEKRIAKARRLGLLPPTDKTPPPRGDSLSRSESDGEQTLDSFSSRIRTVEELLAKAEVDTDAWEVERTLLNQWEVGAKNPKTGKVLVEPLYQVKVWLRRKAPRPIESLVRDLIEDAKRYAPKYPKIVRLAKVPDGERCMLEVSLPDLHLGKLAWRPETGENYDLKIAMRLYDDAIEHFVRRASGLNIERIILPVGNDLFHVDNQYGTTAKGTRQDMDGRWQRVFRSGRNMLIRGVEQLAAIAPVTILRVAGNHDPENCYYICEVLDAWFHNCDRVTVENNPGTRAYVRFGATLLGFTHGDKERIDTLKGLMIDERPMDYAESRHRVWHLGHFHASKEWRYNAGDTHGGVQVEILPSLSGTDAWHYEQGYVKNPKEAKAFIYGRESGPTDVLVWRPPMGVYGVGA